MLAPIDRDRIVAALAATRGVDLRDYRPESIERGIANRLAATAAQDAVRYADLLVTDHDEGRRLVEAIVVPVTAFFRDASVFEALRRTVLPALARVPVDSLRVWSIGAATGEEAWSLAMLLAEACEVTHRRWELFATDLDPGALAHAERGQYSAAAVATIPADLRQRFMEGTRVGPGLRANAHFEAHDLLGRRLAPMGSIVAGFQLVCLRNVLIYFDRRLQEKALQRVVSMIDGGGVLVLGAVETLPPTLEPRLRSFSGLDPSLRIYERRP